MQDKKCYVKDWKKLRDIVIKIHCSDWLSPLVSNSHTRSKNTADNPLSTKLALNSPKKYVQNWTHPAAEPLKSHLDGKVDDSGVFLHEEGVFGEALDAEDQVGRQTRQFEPLDDLLFVGFVLFLLMTVEFVQDGEEWHLAAEMRTVSGRNERDWKTDDFTSSAAEIRPNFSSREYQQ